MTALLWQTGLLLLGAYFLGAFTGCVLRRTFFAGTGAERARAQPVMAPSPPQRLPDPEPVGLAAASGPGPTAYAEPAVPAAARFQRALSGGGEPAAPAGAGAAAERRASVAPPVRSAGTSAAAAAALAAAATRHQAAQAALLRADQRRPDLPAASGTSGQASTSAPIARAPVAPPSRAAAAPAEAPPPDDLTRIRGVDSELQTRLNKLGISRFAQIAAWRAEDVRQIGRSLGSGGRIPQENWIEQAQILAGGGETAFSRRSRGMGPLARPTADEGERRPPAARPAATASRTPTPVGGLAAAMAGSAPAAPPRRSSVGLGRDNLQRISRIGEEVERLLNVQGISRYDQIANWTVSDVTSFERLLGGEGRISRENWIEQAQILARGGETAYSREFDRHAAASTVEPPRPTLLAEAIRSTQAGAARKVDLAALRSVRSEAYRDGEPDEGEAAGPEAAAPRADDLKRIRGVGVLIEKRLNGMGYRTYAQVANWTAADVDRVSQALDFRGRIERENWVEQARILASGGQTEFARRVDRGEVESSRNRR